ncbi:MAG: hypothetical protein MAG431_00125 [Chloroflexi bacterium]|nr:hypothetical protein [Chloroflexota bacterium]
MKERALTMIVILGFLFSACKSAAEPLPESTNTLPPPPTETPQPTATSLPPTPTFTSPPPTPTPTESPPTLDEIADGIAGEVGEVKATYEGDSEEVVYLFAEDHASIGGKLEIAIMLNRLYARQRTRHVGLEGWFASDPPMDLSWAFGPSPYESGAPVTAREDVLAYMVKDGEFTSAEFLGLVYEDVVVHGVDDAELYGITIEPQLWSTPFLYNYEIGINMLNEDEYDTYYGYVIEKETEKAYEFVLQTVEFAQEMENRLRKKASAEDYALILDELKAELEKWAEKNGNPIPARRVEEMANLRAYIDVVIQRSDAMAANILAILESNPGAPLALSTGVMHADRILEVLEGAGVSYAYIWPHALTLDDDPTRMSPEAYQYKEMGKSPGGEGTIGAILRGGKNLPPTGEQARVRTEENLRQILQELSVIDYTKLQSWLLTPNEVPEGMRALFEETGIEAYPIEDSTDNGWRKIGLRVIFPNGAVQKIHLSFMVDEDGNVEKTYSSLPRSYGKVPNRNIQYQISNIYPTTSSYFRRTSWMSSQVRAFGEFGVRVGLRIR